MNPRRQQASRVKHVSKVIVQAPRIQKVSQQSNSHSPHSLRVADLEEERPRWTQATPQLSRAAATASNRCFHAGAFELRPTGGRGGPVLNVHPFKLPQRLKSLHPDMFVIKALQYAQTQSRMWRWHLILGSSPAPLGARERDAAADGRAAHLAATECSPSAAGIARGGGVCFLSSILCPTKVVCFGVSPWKSSPSVLQPSAVSLTVGFLQCRP